MPPTERFPAAVARDVAVRAGHDVEVDLGDIGPHAPDAAARVLATVSRLPEDGRVIVVGSATASSLALAKLRDRLWPTLHVVQLYPFVPGVPLERHEVRGKTRLDGLCERNGFVLVALRRAHALSPEVTAGKFDGTAAGWNGDPAHPSYGHFRWMRRLVAMVGRPRRGERVLDAGSGAGWVGIEAALLGADVSAFDPSAEMVKLVLKNAASVGVSVDARVGFVERPPFPRERPFDLVLNSGVISFAPDPDMFLAGLDPMVAAGGRLVIGDINPRSRGFARRRTRPLLPSRELNGLPRADVEARLVKRGYAIEARRFYQLTWPVPELLHRSDGRAIHAGGLALNRCATATDAFFGSRCERWFDSWILAARKVGAVNAAS